MIDCWRSGEAWRDTACKAEAQALVESLAQGSAGASEGVRTTTKNKVDVLLISPFHKHLLTSVFVACHSLHFWSLRHIWATYTTPCSVHITCTRLNSSKARVSGLCPTALPTSSSAHPPGSTSPSRRHAAGAALLFCPSVRPPTRATQRSRTSASTTNP
jgi:hypothetical protein